MGIQLYNNLNDRSKSETKRLSEGVRRGRGSNTIICTCRYFVQPLTAAGKRKREGEGTERLDERRGAPSTSVRQTRPKGPRQGKTVPDPEEKETRRERELWKLQRHRLCLQELDASLARTSPSGRAGGQTWKEDVRQGNQG